MLWAGAKIILLRRANRFMIRPPFSSLDVRNERIGGSFLEYEVRKHLFKYHKEFGVIGDGQTESVLMVWLFLSSIRDSSALHEFLDFHHRLFTSVVHAKLDC